MVNRTPKHVKPMPISETQNKEDQQVIYYKSRNS